MQLLPQDCYVTIYLSSNLINMHKMLNEHIFENHSIFVSGIFNHQISVQWLYSTKKNSTNPLAFRNLQHNMDAILFHFGHIHDGWWRDSVQMGTKLVGTNRSQSEDQTLQKASKFHCTVKQTFTESFIFQDNKLSFFLQFVMGVFYYKISIGGLHALARYRTSYYRIKLLSTSSTFNIICNFSKRKTVEPYHSALRMDTSK